jgi:hypothetical protein
MRILETAADTNTRPVEMSMESPNICIDVLTLTYCQYASQLWTTSVV